MLPAGWRRRLTLRRSLLRRAYSLAGRDSSVDQYSKHALGRRHAGHAWINFDGLAQGPGRRLENRLDDVMRVAAVVTEDVQGEGPRRRNGPPELLGQRG